MEHWCLIDRVGSPYNKPYLLASEKQRKEKILQQTSFRSFRFVSITIVAAFCSHIIRQKSATVSSFGPEAESKKLEAMQYSESHPCPKVSRKLKQD